MGGLPDAVEVQPKLAEADSMLAQYGDVPVAYAVFRAKLDETRTEVIDIEYVYVNALYRTWLGIGDTELTGRSFLEAVHDADPMWFPYCYRAVVLREGSHDVVYSPEVRRWLRFSVEPSLIEGCCVFAFTLADEERHEREQIEAARDTSDLIIGITNSLSKDTSYDSAMSGLLESMSHVIHPDRLYIIERGEHTSSSVFEWCAPGVESQIDSLQNLDNAAFDAWDRMLTSDSVIVIPDVSAYQGVDDGLYEILTTRGIKRLLVVPFYGHGELIGYLGADNYVLDERLDTRRLLETVASFISGRITNRHLLDELERVSTHDSLTGLLNRRGIDIAIDRRMEDSQNEPFVLALMDIDDFKTINDLYGHAVGDEALRAFAHVLLRTFPGDALVGRNGGDEVLVALFDRSAQDVERFLRRLVGTDMPFDCDGESYTFSVSVGYTWCAGMPEDLKAAYARADSALYAVKLDGKSGFKRFAPGMEEHYRQQLGFSSRAVAENLPEGVVVYQVGSGKMLFANDALADMMECESVSDLLAFLDGNFLGALDPDDRDRAAERLLHVPTSVSRLWIRVVTKTGRVKSVMCSARRADLGGDRDIVYAVLLDGEMPFRDL